MESKKLNQIQAVGDILNLIHLFILQSSLIHIFVIFKIIFKVRGYALFGNEEDNDPALNPSLDPSLALGQIQTTPLINPADERMPTNTPILQHVPILPGLLNANETVPKNENLDQGQDEQVPVPNQVPKIDPGTDAKIDNENTNPAPIKLPFLQELLTSHAQKVKQAKQAKRLGIDVHK